MINVIIDYDYVLERIKEIMDEYNNTEPKDFSKYKLYKIYKKLPLGIKKRIVSFYFSYHDFKDSKKYEIIRDKPFCIDFIYYNMNHKDASFDLDLFEFEEDKKEIIKFVNNKIRAAFQERIPKNKVFDKTDLEIQEKYLSLEKNNIKRRKKHTVIIDPKNHKEYLLSSAPIEIGVFYHKYGRDTLPKETLTKLKNTDFIDAGAYNGDSALILNEFEPKRIFAFEPNSKTYKELIETIELNNLNSIIKPVKAGLGSKESNMILRRNGGGSTIINNQKGSSDLFEEINIKTIDNFVKEHDLNLGLIKMDIEGFETEAILGGKEAIKRYKPVLMICLYHKGRDFFEIPKILKELNPKYHFRFLNLNRTSIYADRVLIAY